MTYALIDNASLTAVQRVLGQIEIKNPDTINGDLVVKTSENQGSALDIDTAYG